MPINLSITLLISGSLGTCH